ncbi:MAG: fructosamine kinase family protein [Acidimicrobiales bacterium]
MPTHPPSDRPPDAVVAETGDGAWTRVRGGDISQAWRLDRDDGSRLFVKHLSTAPGGFFGAEAAGLAFLARPGVIAVPDVIAYGDDPGAGFIALEWIDTGRAEPGSDEVLGRQLAELHLSHADGFGGDGGPAFVGSVPVDGSPAGSWTELWADHRLRPLARQAVSDRRLAPDLARRVEAVADRVDELAGPPEPPARVHGDLWAGNVVFDVDGRPWLIDPAAHGGHRETDLAMMRLFGGFGDRCFAAYEEVAPLADRWRERVPLHQLVPLLVHVILFGGGYESSLSRALDALGA